MSTSRQVIAALAALASTTAISRGAELALEAPG
jgi:hypothetical protein